MRDRTRLVRMLQSVTLITSEKQIADHRAMCTHCGNIGEMQVSLTWFMNELLDFVVVVVSEIQTSVKVS